MASSPPFQVEDQNDDDFFDKLVDDDFGKDDDSSSSPTPAAGLGEDNNSDEGEEFTNLSTKDDESGEEDWLHEAKIENDSLDAGPVDSVSTEVQDDNGPLLVASEEVGLDSTNEVNEEPPRPEDSVSVYDSAEVSKNSGTGGFGIKEVGWNSFYADASETEVHGFGSYSDFFTELNEGAEGFPGEVVENVNVGGKNVSVDTKTRAFGSENPIEQTEYTHNLENTSSVEAVANEQDVNSSEYWENMYPGWKYDTNTGQWYQVNDSGVGTTGEGSYGNTASEYNVVNNDTQAEVTYSKQSAQSVTEKVAETSTTESVSNWNQVSSSTEDVSSWNQASQPNHSYPDHMVFDPQYPGWYYDTIAQEWRTMESYNAAAQSTVEAHDQQVQNAYTTAGVYPQNNNSSLYNEYGEADKYSSQNLGSRDQHGNWTETNGGGNQQDFHMWQPETVTKTEAVAKPVELSNFSGNQQIGNYYDLNGYIDNHADQQNYYNSRGTIASNDKTSHTHSHFGANENTRMQGSASSVNFGQQFNAASGKKNHQRSFSYDFYSSHTAVNDSKQSFQGSQGFSYAPAAGRSPDGRPSHALVTFGFGGKLLVMKDNDSLQNSSFGNQDNVGTAISVLNLMEMVAGSTNANVGGSCSYFHALCQQSFPGPLVGGNAGSKDLHKWIDEMVANCGTLHKDYRKGELLQLLMSLLKIACQHYGKLRSSFGVDTTSREADSPESAVANLFASAKKNGTPYSAYGAPSNCLQQLPSEGQLRATASEVQNLLVSGKRREALQCAQEGQLWGPALVIASQLGDQFYIDSVKQMALHQLVAGTPLRTLCLLIAGQPAEVFSMDADKALASSANISQQQAQVKANSMLDDWEENLAVITANRTKDDELVIMHLGDCMWKDRSEITAAHICYLVAEANFEVYSDTARLCLIGSDHWKFPRTFASPEAIQRTELYEYSKVLGNSQYILLPFQPYKLIYACMLAEIGRVSDALKYCQALSKSLKTGRSPEVETWKQLVSSFEERIRIHQQGGYATNLAPAKFVGKLLNFFDSTAHRVVGLPPAGPSATHGHGQVNDNRHQHTAPRVSASQSTTTMSSLMPPSSMEPISGSDGNRKGMHNRSISEPDFGRSPRQVSPKEDSAVGGQGKGTGVASRFGRFGFGSQLFQRTVGLVLRPRSGKQAKLGETNKFYYDETLKRWVEEGTAPPAEEAALAPPPKAAAFQNGSSDYGPKSPPINETSPSGGSPKYSTPSIDGSGIPPIPSNSNQFSARGRTGVRSRYVDTFNKGRGSSANQFQPPLSPSVKPGPATTQKFFIPSAVPSEQTMESISEHIQEDDSSNKITSTSSGNNDSEQTPTPPTYIQRHPSMKNMTRNGASINRSDLIIPHSRRTASWSGANYSGLYSPHDPSGDTWTFLSPSSPMPRTPMPRTPMPRTPMPRSGSVGEDLHEVEL